MKSPIRILAIDGGGVGGIIPARLLQRLQAIDPRVIANADVIAGTSTGGLISLGLACGKTAAELCDIYLTKAREIFSRGNRRYLIARAVRSKFRPDGLIDAVKAIAGELTLGELTRKHVFIPITAIGRPDESHRPAGIFVSTAWRLTGSVAHEKYASSRWKCVDAALATAAAPTYFPAHVVEHPDDPARGKWVCWDGGVVANNPSLAAVGEILRLDLAMKAETARTGPADSPDIRVLSIGTGYRNIDISGGDWGLIQSARPVIATLMDASVGSSAFLTRQFLGERAFRLNVALQSDYEMDDPSVMDQLDRLAGQLADGGFDGIRQLDGSVVNLTDWLKEFWFPPANG